ncbi:hypothetical protein [Gehongia tenuis]|uniref:Uncharacterized protein n=1 Tax=Gehongia tenuis TaxID=2763655 RepID=A0A926D567_9FIRM|nr:hypothetical protein [Gehongia tenuis]MBC8531811.1 hypothetical protein [Gehongia tenuis]
MGLTSADMDNFSTGMLLDAITTYNNLMANADDDEADRSQRYEQLLALKDAYAQKFAAGKMTHEQYQSYLDALKEGEQYGGQH